MDAQKWKHLFFSFGLPLIGLGLKQFYPVAHDALCQPFRSLEQQETNVLSMSASIEGTYDRLREFVDKQKWGDYPLENEGGWV
jgi:hypothetical protein